MLNRLAAVVGLVLIVVYLGGYAVLLNTAPLWIIIFVVLAMIVVETVEAVRAAAGNDNGGT